MHSREQLANDFRRLGVEADEIVLAAPSIAMDLPLKILVWKDGQGKVWVSYNSPDYLMDRHNRPLDLLQNIAIVETLAGKAGV